MSLVDIEAALRELDLTHEEFLEFMDDLKDFTYNNFPSLKEATKQSDILAVREIAHSFKGAFSNLRFIKVAEMAFRLERIAAGNEDGDVDSLCNDLEVCIRSSFEEIGIQL